MRYTSKSLVILCLLVTLLSSCATSSGRSVERSGERDRQERKREDTTTSPPPLPDSTMPSQQRPYLWNEKELRPVRKGFSIQSNPSGALVIIDGKAVGSTPYDRDSSSRVTGSVLLIKEGYRNQSFTLSSRGDGWEIYNFTLDPLLGILRLGETYHGAQISTEDGSSLSPGNNPLLIGPHRITSHRFGYEDIEQTVQIFENETVVLETQWKEAPLRALSFDLESVWKREANEIGFLFSVSGPGSGILTISDSEGALLSSIPLGPFHERNQQIVWTPTKRQLFLLVPGEYCAVLSIGEAMPLTLNFMLDYTQNAAEKGEFWSSGTGALYAVRAKTIEKDTCAFNTSLMGVSGGSYIQFLENTGVLFGIKDDCELGVSFANRIWNDPYLNSWYLTTGVKNTFLQNGFIKVGWYSSLSLSSFWDTDEIISPTTDPFTNPVGLKGGLAFSFGNENMELSVDPELVWAWKGVSYEIESEAKAGFIGFLRGSVDYKTDFAQFVLSGALRSQNFSSGARIALPLQSGFEVRFPFKEGLGITALSALEWWNVHDWALYLGLGFSALGSSSGDSNKRNILPRK